MFSKGATWAVYKKWHSVFFIPLGLILLTLKIEDIICKSEVISAICIDLEVFFLFIFHCIWEWLLGVSI